MKTILVDAAYCFTIPNGDKFEIFKDLQDLLETYPNKKILLTGADEEGIKKYALDNVPYEVFSLKHNPEKTNPEYYKIFLEKYNLKASDVISFEHNFDAVKSSEYIGIKTFFYDQDKKDITSLKSFLDENLK